MALELELIAPTVIYKIEDTEKQTLLQMDENVTVASLDSELERKRKDKPLSMWLILLGHISIFIAFIILLISRFIIMYQYPNAIYLEFHLQLSEIEELTPDTTDTYQVKNFDTLYPIITMRYTSCNINDQRLEPQSYQDSVYGHPLAIWMETIADYGMVCVMCCFGVFLYKLTGLFLSQFGLYVVH